MGLWDKAKKTVNKGVDKATDAGNDVAESVDNTVDNTVDRAKDTAQDVGQAVDETVDQAKDVGSDVAESADDTIDNTVDQAQDTASDIGKSIDRTVDNTADRATDTASDVGKAIDRTVDNTADRAQDTANDVGRSIDQTVDNTADKAADTATDIQDSATDTLEEAKQTLSDAPKTGKRTANRVGNSVDTAVDRGQRVADERLRDATDGRVGVSDDFTTTDDSGGVGNVVDRATDPVQERGRDFRQRRDQEGEQFGNIDWSFGRGDPNKDEVEQAAEDFQQGARNRARDVGDGIFAEDGGATTDTSIGEFILDQAGREDLGDQYDRQLRNFGRGLISEPASAVGSAPKMGMEGVETTKYAVTNPGEFVSKAPDAAAASGVSMAEAARQNPAQTAGGLVAGALIGTGVSRGIRTGRSTRSSGSTRSRSGRSTGGTREPRIMTGSGADRGQLTLGRIGSDGDGSGGSSRTSSGSSGSDGGSSVLPDDIDSMLNQMENAQSRREGKQRAEQNIIEKRLEEGRRQERGDEPRTVSNDGPGGDYTAPKRGGDYTVSKEPDTSRSRPTEAQSSAGRSGLDTDLSPRESQLAAKLGRQTPEVDARGVDATSRSTPSTDMRIDAMSSGSSKTGAMGAAGGGAIPLLEQAQQSQVTVDDEGPSGSTEDTGIRGQSDAGDSLDLLDDAQNGPSLEDWLTGLGVGTGTSTGTGTNTGTTGTGTGTSTGINTNTGTTVDTGTTTDSDSGTKTGDGTDTETGPGPVTPPPTSTTPVPPIGDPTRTPTPPSDPPVRPPNRNPPKRPEFERDSGIDLSLDTFSSGPTAPRGTESDLQPGWFSETITTIGTQGTETPTAPSQQALEEQPLGLRLTGNLPTSQMLEGDEGVQEAQGLFSFGFGGPTDAGGRSSSSASSESSGSSGGGLGLDLDFGFGSDDEEEGWFL